jgi:hypothetical protein
VAAVRAFAGAIWAEMGAAPSRRCSHSRWPPSSTMAMTTAQPCASAAAAAAAAVFLYGAWGLGSFPHDFVGN